MERVPQHTVNIITAFLSSFLIFYCIISSYHIRLKLWLLHSTNQDINHSRPSVCHHSVPRGWRCVLPLKATFPKQIFPIVKHKGAFSKSLWNTSKSTIPLSCICLSVWTIWTEELAESILMLWCCQLNTEAEAKAVSHKPHVAVGELNWTKQKTKHGTLNLIFHLISVIFKLRLSYSALIDYPWFSTFLCPSYAAAWATLPSPRQLLEYCLRTNIQI